MCIRDRCVCVCVLFWTYATLFTVFYLSDVTVLVLFPSVLWYHLFSSSLGDILNFLLSLLINRSKKMSKGNHMQLNSARAHTKIHTHIKVFHCSTLRCSLQYDKLNRSWDNNNIFIMHH